MLGPHTQKEPTGGKWAVCLSPFMFQTNSMKSHSKKHLQNDIFCVGWDVKPLLNQSINQPHSEGTVIECKEQQQYSVRLSVCLSIHLSQPGPTADNTLLQVRCCGPSREEISVSCCSSCAKHLTVESYMVIYATNSCTYYY